jgi:Carboxypeptidase regulatory-like domain
MLRGRELEAGKRRSQGWLGAESRGFHFRCWVFVLLFIATIASFPAGAQVDYASATLRGTIFDPQGAVVSAATVTVTNPLTGISQSQMADATGTYQIQALTPGTYDLVVEAKSFSRAVAKNVVLTVGQILTYDIHMTVGPFSETVEVADRPLLIETERTQQANTVDNLQVVNLPNVSRNFAQAIYTVPGVVDSQAPSLQDPNIGTGYLASGFSIGGSNGRNNLFTIDGGEDDFGSGALRVQHVPLESIQEYQVNRNSLEAEFGFTTGTSINIVTRTGTNKFHGSAYGYFHDEATDAANFFNRFSSNPASKPFEQSLIAGGTLGGPIEKDRLFFFTSFEHQKLDSAVLVNLLGTAEAIGVAAQDNGFNPATGLCPGQTSNPPQVTQRCYLAQMAGLGGPLAPVASALLASPVFNPLQDPILARLLDADSGTFDGNAGGYVQAPPNQNGRYNNWVSRLDYVPNIQDSFTLRFSMMREVNRVTGAGGAPRYTSTTNPARDYTATAGWTHLFGSNLVSTLRVQVVPHDSADAFAPYPDRAEINLGSLGTVGTPFAYPYLGHENRFQFDGNISWLKAGHNFKLGASYRPVDYSVYQEVWFGGQYNFADGAIPIIGLFASQPPLQAGLASYNTALGYPAAGPASTNLTAAESYVAGVPITLLQAAGNGRWQGWDHYLGVYAQDSWKVSPRFTMNYGARADYDNEPHPVPHSIHVSPRLGVAFDPLGDGKTVIRAGGGIFVAPVLFLVPFYLNDLGPNGQHINLALQTITGQPGELLIATAMERAAATLSNPNPELNSAQLAAAGITIQPPGPAAVNGVFYTIQPNFKPQYSIQSSMSVARQLGPNLALEVGYNLYRSLHIEQSLEANYQVNPALPVDPFVGPFYEPKPGVTAGEPNAVILQNNQYSSTGSSIYHGLTASLSKRYSRGLEFQVNYTFSRAIDDTSDYSSLSTPFRPGLLDRDRSVSDFNITHNFVANAVYTTPFHAGGRDFFSKLFADISISPVVYARSGVPFTLLVPGLANGAGSHNSEARPFHEGRNSGVGPNYFSWDMRISKAFYLRRDPGVRLEVIAQATDLLNRTNFSAVNNIFPDTAVADPATGLTQSAVVPTPEGTVDLLNGPYRYKGFVPTSASQLSTPLAFASAHPPRQVSFGLQLAF